MKSVQPAHTRCLTAGYGQRFRENCERHVKFPGVLSRDDDDLPNGSKEVRQHGSHDPSRMRTRDRLLRHDAPLPSKRPHAEQVAALGATRPAR